MKIAGLQKLTLLDYPGYTACTVFTAGCNLRCPFCHNALLVLPDDNTACINEDEFFAFLKKRQGLLDGVAITGGEPLLQPGLDTFVKKIKELGYKVKLDTNGAYPEKLMPLLEEELVDYVAMDIKNSLDKYPLTTGIKNLDTTPFVKTIELIKTSGTDFEFRTTVTAEHHTKEDIVSVANLIGKGAKYYLQSYKKSEFMLTDDCSAPSEDEIREWAEAAKEITGYCSVRGI